MRLCFFFISCMALLISGCGQSGALYLPTSTHATTSAEVSSSPAPAHS